MKCIFDVLDWSHKESLDLRTEKKKKKMSDFDEDSSEDKALDLCSPDTFQDTMANADAHGDGADDHDKNNNNNNNNINNNNSNNHSTHRRRRKSNQAPLELSDALVSDAVNGTRDRWSTVLADDGLIMDDFLVRCGARIFGDFLARSTSADWLIKSLMLPSYNSAVEYFNSRQAIASSESVTARIQFRMPRKPLLDDASMHAAVNEFACELTNFYVQENNLPPINFVSAGGELDLRSDLLEAVRLATLPPKMARSMLAMLMANVGWSNHPAELLFLTSLCTIDRESVACPPPALVRLSKGQFDCAGSLSDGALAQKASDCRCSR
jgi:hypothetical protein